MLKKFFDNILGGNTLYYPGCLTKFALPKIQKNYEEILRKLGRDFIILESEELCCGAPPLRAGYKEDFENLKKKNKAIFKKYAVKQIITNCPSCLHIFKEEYGIPIKHVTEILWENRKKLKKLNFQNQEIFYHDPCHLGRYSRIYDQPRNVLKDLEFKIKELSQNRNFSFCCGAGGGLKTNCPQSSNEIAQTVLKECEGKILVTPCPMCYVQFKENAKGETKVNSHTKKIGVRVKEFSELINNK